MRRSSTQNLKEGRHMFNVRTNRGVKRACRSVPSLWCHCGDATRNRESDRGPGDRSSRNKKREREREKREREKREREKREKREILSRYSTVVHLAVARDSWYFSRTTRSPYYIRVSERTEKPSFAVNQGVIKHIKRERAPPLYFLSLPL